MCCCVSIHLEWGRTCAADECCGPSRVTGLTGSELIRVPGEFIQNPGTTTHTFAYTHSCSNNILSKVVGARVIIYICHCLSDGTMDSWTPAMVDIEDMMGPFVIFLSGFLGCYGGGDGLGWGKRWGVLIFTSNFAIKTTGRRSYCTRCCQHLFGNFVQLCSPAFAE